MFLYFNIMLRKLFEGIKNCFKRIFIGKRTIIEHEGEKVAVFKPSIFFKLYHYTVVPIRETFEKPIVYIREPYGKKMFLNDLRAYLYHENPFAANFRNLYHYVEYYKTIFRPFFFFIYINILYVMFSSIGFFEFIGLLVYVGLFISYIGFILKMFLIKLVLFTFFYILFVYVFEDVLLDYLNMYEHVKYILYLLSLLFSLSFMLVFI